MAEFWDALLAFEFLQNAMIAGVLVSVASGIIGSFVVVRRITAIAGCIAHFVLSGIGAAIYLNKVHGLMWLSPLYGALISAVFAALLIGWLTQQHKQNEDAVIGTLWAMGMATGILFIYKTPGYAEDLMSYLFGNILMISRTDLWFIFILDILVLGAGVTYFNQLQAVCFDEEFARVRGLKVRFYYYLLLCLSAITVVMLANVVGVVMVIALLTIPVAIASCFCHRLMGMILVSSVVGMVCVTGGTIASFQMDLPAGSAIILFAGTIYFLSLIFKTAYKISISNGCRNDKTSG
jgi:zinc transport system permease protein